MTTYKKYKVGKYRDVICILQRDKNSDRLRFKRKINESPRRSSNTKTFNALQ